MNEQGMLHLYIGDGKGKTTAAVGLVIRALGQGFKVLFAQFLKNTDTGEKAILENYPEALRFFRPVQRHRTFLWNMTREQLAETKEDLKRGWESLKKEIASGGWDMVVMDEILDCVQAGLIDEEDILKAIQNRPEHVEVVCTGRNASEAFRDAADYISLIDAVKHPYRKGLKARRGIEY